MTLQTVVLIGFIGALIGCSNNPGAASDASTAAPPASPIAKPDNHDAATTGQTGDFEPNAAGSAGASTDAATPSSAEECTRRGGTWRQAGLMKLDVCDLPMADAGKPCQNDAECESVCVAPEGADPSGPVTGQCYRSNITVGTCLSLVEDGRITQAQCAD